MKSNAGIKILLSIFAVLAFQLTVFSQTTDDLLNTQVKLNMSETCLFVVLIKLAFEFRIPIGLELPSDYREKEFQKMFFDENNRLKWDDHLVVKEGTLKEILNSLVEQEPQFNWLMKDGVVNVFPIKSRDAVLNRLLKIKLRLNGEEKNIDSGKIFGLLSSTRKFNELIEKEKVKLYKNDPLNQPYRSDPTAKIIETDLKKTDVRGLLNMFVKKSNQKIWILERTTENELSFNF